MTKALGKKTPGTNGRSYREMLMAFPPKPIKTESDFFETQKIIDTLLDQNDLNHDEKDYLNLLGILVWEYEQSQESIPDIYGVDLLVVLIEENNLKQKDLVPIFKTESIVSDVLHKKRRLTVDHIKGLATFFHISPAAFFPNTAMLHLET